MPKISNFDFFIYPYSGTPGRPQLTLEEKRRRKEAKRLQELKEKEEAELLSAALVDSQPSRSGRVRKPSRYVFFDIAALHSERNNFEMEEVTFLQDNSSRKE